MVSEGPAGAGDDVLSGGGVDTEGGRGEARLGTGVGRLDGMSKSRESARFPKML
jgi:hypothetical protein